MGIGGGVAYLNTVFNDSSKTITVYDQHDKLQSTVRTNVAMTMNLHVPINEADGRVGLTICRGKNLEEDPQFYITDDGNWNLCFMDESFTADSCKYRLHICTHWWNPEKHRFFNIHITDDQTYFEVISNDLGFYEKDDYTRYQVYGFQLEGNKYGVVPRSKIDMNIADEKEKTGQTSGPAGGR